MDVDQAGSGFLTLGKRDGQNPVLQFGLDILRVHGARQLQALAQLSPGFLLVALAGLNRQQAVFYFQFELFLEHARKFHAHMVLVAFLVNVHFRASVVRVVGWISKLEQAREAGEAEEVLAVGEAVEEGWSIAVRGDQFHILIALVYVGSDLVGLVLVAFLDRAIMGPTLFY